VLQQSTSEHPGLPLGDAEQQSLDEPPQGLGQSMLHSECASEAQMPSHWTWQQNASAAQTMVQQSTSEQPGVPSGDGKQQSLEPPHAGFGQVPPAQRSPHRVAASPAQMLSHVKSQQNKSTPQTVFWHDGQSQPGPPLALQQLLEQSELQVSFAR
jgi:hypothetical protein